MKPIKTVEQVMKLAEQKKSIFFPRMGFNGKIIPAAFVQNFQARRLFTAIKGGVLFIYEKPKK